MTRSLMLSVLLFLSACSMHRAPAWPMEKVLPSIGHLFVADDDGVMKGECSSFAISKRVAITASHCLVEGGTVLFVGEQRVSVPLDFGEMDPNGIVVVRADRDAFVPMKLGPKPVIGEEIAMIGHGFGSPQPLIWTGVLITNRMLAPGEDEPYIMFISPGSIGGMSGSPIVNRLGQVVGVTMGSFEGALKNVSWGVEYDTLKAVWKRWE